MIKRIATIVTTLATLVFGAGTEAAPLIQSKAHAVFADAEVRFEEPPATWFAETQQALAEEVRRIDGILEGQGRAYADAWKTHLRWELLQRNLGPQPTVNVDELATVRRWMYSNRKGLEGPLFAEIRKRTDAYLDAAFTLAHADLRATFLEKVKLAGAQCLALEAAPTDANAAALARTLGWFERTRQLPAEVAEVRRLTSLPNAQMVISAPLVRRIAAMQDTVTETIPVTSRVTVEGTRPWQRDREMTVRGSATTTGRVEIQLVPNDKQAELQLVYQGSVESTARGVTGPVTIHLKVDGVANTLKPVYFGPGGITTGDTAVTPRVRSRVAGVTSDIEIVRRIGDRRASQPEAKKLMDAEASKATVENLKSRFDVRVEEAIEKLRADVARIRGSMNEMSEMTAPLAREGAQPSFDHARTTKEAMELNVFARSRDQHGASAACPIDSIEADILFRVHTSCFNNMAETITGGKRLSDEFMMKYAKILHAELPLPLMVHSRTPRWAITMAKHRSIEVTIPSANRFVFYVRVERLTVGDQEFAAPTTATIAYRLGTNEFGEYQLEREGGVELDTELPAEAAAFLHEKLDAFFGPLLNGGGVIVPEGGVLGSLTRLESQGVHAEHEWIVGGVNVPAAVIEEMMQRMGGEAQSEGPRVAELLSAGQ